LKLLGRRWSRLSQPKVEGNLDAIKQADGVSLTGDGRALTLTLFTLRRQTGRINFEAAGHKLC
jgi:hypothetical protein